MSGRPPVQRKPPPQTLHLARLAQGMPGGWVALPGGALRVLALEGRLGPQVESGWLTCLTGEAILDLPHGDFVRLRAAEGYRVTAGEPWKPLPVRSGTVLLLVPEGEG